MFGRAVTFSPSVRIMIAVSSGYGILRTLGVWCVRCESITCPFLRLCPCLIITRELKTPFTRDRVRVVSTSSSVSLRSYLLLPLFLWYALITFCNIIRNLRVMLVLRLFKLIWWPYGSGPMWTGSRMYHVTRSMTLSKFQHHNECLVINYALKQTSEACRTRELLAGQKLLVFVSSADSSPFAGGF